MPLRLAVLASGNGSNLQAMLDRIADGALDADIRLVLCNRADAFALTRAERAGVPALCLEHRAFPSREAFDAAMVAAIREAGADTVALAGFMRMLTPVFLDAFAGRILNIHPALLPAFAGVRGAGDALDYGVKITGCTVHLVDEIMDHGAVIIQAAVPVMAGEPLDDLAQRIHCLEHRLFPQALHWLAQGRLRLIDRTVHLAPAREPARLAQLDGPALVWPPLEEGF